MRRRLPLVRALTSARTIWLAAAAVGAALVATFVLAANSGYRDGLVDTRLDSLLVSAETFAAAIAAGGTVDANGLAVDPDRLVAAGRGDVPSTQAPGSHPLAHALDPERIDRLIDRLAEPAELRARVYDRQGGTIADSSGAPALPDLRRITLTGPPLANAAASAEEPPPGWLTALSNRLDRLLDVRELAPYPDTQVLRADAFPEVLDALDGVPAAAVRRADDGRVVMSVAVPIRRLDTEVGALLLETVRDDITPLVVVERRRVLNAAALAAALAFALAVVAAVALETPLQRLARRIRAIRSNGRPLEAPELERRRDAVGEIARDVAALTRRCAQRIEALEAFSADVAHELKNPLTSLRSACDTLPLAATPEAQRKLVDIIRHDVDRIDRLISDIAAAARLDAELSDREDARVNLVDLLEAVVVVQRELAAPRGQSVELSVLTPAGSEPLLVRGSDSRLGEVFTNLIDNARSFTPDGGRIEITVARRAEFVEIRVDDEGPGIKEGTAERIFERFYTDRGDAAAFGNNSGLGLSICRQIVQAYEGAIFAENRYTTSLGPDRRVLGARFVVQLPLAG